MAGALNVLVPWAGHPAAADTGCSSDATYSAVASVAGVSTLVSAPGVTVVDAVDLSLPGAQASYDSLTGSTGWAGAPYSDTAAGNAGAAGVSSSQVPVFAVSGYPAQPQTTKSTGVATLETKSGAEGSSSSVVLGATPAGEQLPSNGVTISASAACASDGTLQATADGTIESLDVAGVLRIGSVSSHAKVVVDPSGKRHLSAALEVQAASILGQPVSITPQGLVVGSAVLPGSVNPLLQALAGAGVTIQYVSAVQDPQHGQVLAPALQVIVSRRISGLGSGPVATTYTFGRAFASASTTGGAAPAASPPASTAPPSTPAGTSAGSGPLPASPPFIVGNPTASGSIPTTAPPSPALRAERPVTTTLTARLASWSIAPAYAALAIGLLLLLTVRTLFEKLAARFQWT